MIDPQEQNCQDNITDTPSASDELLTEEISEIPPLISDDVAPEQADAEIAIDASEPPAPATRSGLFSLVLEYLELFVICLCTILLLFSFAFRFCSVSGDSMLPTLKDGQLLLVSNLFYEPEAGDIIIFHQTSEEIARFNEPIVKRVIATEGQTVRIDFTAGTVEIDGELLQEDYIQLVDTLGQSIDEYRVFAEHHIQMIPLSDGTTHRIFEATVPEGTLFVMGDNRNNSSDSRTRVIGFVDERRVLGHVVCRLTPLEAFGTVD